MRRPSGGSGVVPGCGEFWGGGGPARGAGRCGARAMPLSAANRRDLQNEGRWIGQGNLGDSWDAPAQWGPGMGGVCWCARGVRRGECRGTGAMLVSNANRHDLQPQVLRACKGRSRDTQRPQRMMHIENCWRWLRTQKGQSLSRSLHKIHRYKYAMNY